MNYSIGLDLKARIGVGEGQGGGFAHQPLDRHGLGLGLQSQDSIASCLVTDNIMTGMSKLGACEEYKSMHNWRTIVASPKSSWKYKVWIVPA
jgi:hypothetical protein